MSQTKYSKDHEWIILEAENQNIGRIGITDYAKESLGDLVYLELPDAGQHLNKGDEFAVVESVKAASEIYTPVSGEIVAVNEDLAQALDSLKEDYDKGWIVTLRLDDTAQLETLMDRTAYDAFLEGLD